MTDLHNNITAWVTFWNTYDLSALDQLFLIDDRMTYFSSEKEGILRGIDALREHHVKFGFVLGGKTHTNRLWLEALQTDVFGEAAVATAIWCFQRADGPIQRGPVTFVYVLVNNDYRIAHVNFGNYPKK